MIPFVGLDQGPTMMKQYSFGMTNQSLIIIILVQTYQKQLLRVVESVVL